MSFTDETPDPISGNVLSSSPPNNRLYPLKTPSTPRINIGVDDDVTKARDHSRDRSHDRSPRRVQVLNLGKERQ